MLVNEAEQVRCRTQELRGPINSHQRGTVVLRHAGMRAGKEGCVKERGLREGGISLSNEEVSLSDEGICIGR